MRISPAFGDKSPIHPQLKSSTENIRQNKMKISRFLLSSCTADSGFPVMQIPFVCLLTSSMLLFCQALEATLISIPESDASAPIAPVAGLANSTLGIPQPPEGLDLTYEIGGPKLRTTSCLVNAVAALKELALGDWDRKIIDGTEYRLDSYPEVSIIVTTSKRLRNIKAGLLTWAICLGVQEMITKKKFEFAQIEISWYGLKLGWVQVVNHPPRAGLIVEQRQSNETLDMGNKSVTLLSTSRSANITNLVATDNADDPAEARLNVTFEPYDGTLGVYDVFVPVMHGLTDLAKIPSTVESAGLMISVNGFKSYLCFVPETPPRTNPPVLQYGWLVRTIARIPTYMLENGRFSKVKIIIKVDEVIVGYGRMGAALDCNDDGLLLAPSGVAQS